MQYIYTGQPVKKCFCVLASVLRDGVWLGEVLQKREGKGGEMMASSQYLEDDPIKGCSHCWFDWVWGDVGCCFISIHCLHFCCTTN
jgi:hypothetical protein